MAQCPSLGDLPIILPVPPVPPPVGLQFEEMDYTVEDGGFTDLLNQILGNAGDSTDGFDQMFAAVSSAADVLQSDLLGFDPDLDGATQTGATDSAFDSAGVSQAATDASTAIGSQSTDLGGQLGIVPAPPTPPTQPVGPGGGGGGGNPPPQPLPPCTTTLDFGQVKQFDPPTSQTYRVSWAKIGTEPNSFPSVAIASDPNGQFGADAEQDGNLTKVEEFIVTFTLTPTVAGTVHAEARIFSNSAAGLEWDVCLNAVIVAPPPPAPRASDLAFPDTALFASSAPLNPYDNTLGNPNFLSDSPIVTVIGDTYGQFTHATVPGPIVNGASTVLVRFTFTPKVAGPATATANIKPILGGPDTIKLTGMAVNTGATPPGVTFVQGIAITDFNPTANGLQAGEVEFYTAGPTDPFVPPTFTTWNDPLGQFTATATPYLQLPDRWEYFVFVTLTKKQPGPVDVWVTWVPNEEPYGVLAMHITGTLT